MPELPEHILAETGFRIIAYDFQVLGLCPRCRMQREEPVDKSNQRKENPE